MGVGIFPIFNPPVEGATFDSDGKLLAAELYALDGICAELGVTKLSAFTDNREPPPGFAFDPEGDLDDFENLLGEWEEWFDPASALPAVQSLRQAISSRGSIAAKVRDAHMITEDLRELEASLQAAVTAGSKFRLEIF